MSKREKWKDIPASTEPDSVHIINGCVSSHQQEKKKLAEEREGEKDGISIV
jgi:hypothetical protein